MKCKQYAWKESSGWNTALNATNFSPQLILAFGGIDVIDQKVILEDLRSKFPNANIVFTSTAGEIVYDEVVDNQVICNCIEYEKSRLIFKNINFKDYGDSYECGKELADSFEKDDLKHLLIISDGIAVNGDKLAAGLSENLPDEVLVTGGLAGDQGRFTKTLTGLNETPSEGNIIAIAHYGDELVIKHGSKGGWDEFGPVRTITKSDKNVIHEIDGKNALDLYKKYLGAKANELPGSALLFPLSIATEKGNLVRTILSIDEKTGTMTFAGDVPEGAKCRFMMANFDKLIDGASLAAEQTERGKLDEESFVLMVSCVGRKLVLNQRIDEEVESVIEYFGNSAVFSGFYSNGELAPGADSNACALHNQTMTITTYSES